MSEDQIPIDETKKQRRTLPEHPTGAKGDIEVAGIVYEDSDGFMRYDPATRHADADEVVAALLADNPPLLQRVMYWYDRFEPHPGTNAWEAMHGH